MSTTDTELSLEDRVTALEATRRLDEAEREHDRQRQAIADAFERGKFWQKDEAARQLEESAARRRAGDFDLLIGLAIAAAVATVAFVGLEIARRQGFALA